MSFQSIAAVLPAASKESFSLYLPYLDGIAGTYEINTPLRQAHFLAQIAHESGGFRLNKENLNYSAQALGSVFRKYFPTAQQAAQYARQPEAIANVVYANRMGNGDTASGDGWRYRGRGLVQLTGKYNYLVYAKERGQDFVNNPDLLLEPVWSIDVAGWFWKSRGLNTLADKDDVRGITKLINGGYNGLDDRIKYLGLFKKALHI